MAVSRLRDRRLAGKRFDLTAASLYQDVAIYLTIGRCIQTRYPVLPARSTPSCWERLRFPIDTHVAPSEHTPWTLATPTNTDMDRESLLRRLALESFWDGSVAEGAAAAVARRSAPVARDEVTRLALQTIARDETNHAELAKHILAYALDAGGRAVRDTLMESFEHKRAHEEAEMSAEIEDVATEPLVDETFARAYGLAGRSIANAARIEAWEKSVAMLP